MYIYHLFQDMSDFSFLAVPNIQGMLLWWYIQIFGIVFLFGVCLFFVIYFGLIYRRNKAVLRQLDAFDHQTHDLEKQLLLQKIRIASDKTKLVLFIDYLQRFITNKTTDKLVHPYASVSELLLSQWFVDKDVEICEKILYQKEELSPHIATKIDEYFATHN